MGGGTHISAHNQRGGRSASEFISLGAAFSQWLSRARVWSLTSRGLMPGQSHEAWFTFHRNNQCYVSEAEGRYVQNEGYWLDGMPTSLGTVCDGIMGRACLWIFSSWVDKGTKKQMDKEKEGWKSAFTSYLLHNYSQTWAIVRDSPWIKALYSSE